MTMRIDRATLIAGALAAVLASSFAAGPSAALADELTSRPALPLRIAIDGGYSSWSETEIEERAELGAPLTRHEWDPEEPVDAQDEVMEVAAGRIGTRIQALLGANQLPDPIAYREWVLAFIARYGPGGSFWSEHPEYNAERYAIVTFELGNEPYFGGMSPEEYADTVRPTLEALDDLHPPVRIILPSRVYGSDTSWMDTLYARIPNLNELFHAFAEHPYWYGRSPTALGSASPLGRIETLRQRMNEHGAANKPIWITEYGQSTASCGTECVSEDTQALHLQEMLTAILTHPEWRVRTIAIFQLRDRGTDSADRELQFGLLREDGSPKPAYWLIWTAIQALR
jgi:hypothetical protein